MNKLLLVNNLKGLTQIYCWPALLPHQLLQGLTCPSYCGSQFASNFMLILVDHCSLLLCQFLWVTFFLLLPPCWLVCALVSMRLLVCTCMWLYFTEYFSVTGAEVVAMVTKDTSQWHTPHHAAPTLKAHLSVMCLKEGLHDSAHVHETINCVVNEPN